MKINLKQQKKFFRSLRFRILLILVLIGIIPSMIAASVVVHSYRERAINIRTQTVKTQCDILGNSLAAENYLEDPDSETINSQISLLSTIYSGRVMIIDSDFRVIRDTYDLDTGKYSVSREVIDCFNTNKGDTLIDNSAAYVEFIVPIESENATIPDGVLLVSVSTNEIHQNARILENTGILTSSVISIIVLICGYFLATLLVHPLKRVTKAIEDVTDGYEDEAISVPDCTETEQIISAFNQMLARVRALDNSRQEFVSNVSHELKTPLTSMKVLADSLNGQEGIPVELYQEFMSDIANEIDRENNIISDLLSMTRLEKKAATMNVARHEIGELLEEIIARLSPIAQKRSIDLIMRSDREIFADVDASKIALAFTNLIENAIKYNIDDGWVRVTLSSDRKYFYVTIADCGMGIAEDQIDHVFERFYRGDKSHSTEIEGTGLGLAIAQKAILLHRGVIRVKSRLGEGTTFEVRVPLNWQE